MKATLLTRDFAKALSISSRFVAARANLPILANIVLRAEKSKVTLLSTDLEISLASQVGATVAEEGEIAIPAKTFTEIISNLGGENVDIHTEGEVVHILSEGFKSHVNGVNTSDYPTVLTTVSESATSLPTRVFIPSLTKVLFAASTDEARPTLTGVLFLFRKDEVVCVSTDGFRLSQKKFNCEGITDERRVIVPHRILSEITRLAGGGDVLFEIKEEDHQVVFGLPQMVLTSRVLEGEFPNFDRIMPKMTKVTVNVSKDELARAVKLASVFARDSANTIKVAVRDNELVVSAESPRSGQETLSIPAKVEGERVEVSFNYRFIEEFLTVVSGESVDLKMNAMDSPSMFLDPKDASFLHLIMPVRS